MMEVDIKNKLRAPSGGVIYLSDWVESCVWKMGEITKVWFREGR